MVVQASFRVIVISEGGESYIAIRAAPWSTDLDEADPFHGSGADGLERESFNVVRLDAEGVEHGPRVRVEHAIHLSVDHCLNRIKTRRRFFQQ